MKRFKTLLAWCVTLMIVTSCNTTKNLQLPLVDDDGNCTINLSELSGNTIDLGNNRGDTCLINGYYVGDRIVFKNGHDVSLIVDTFAYIRSTHTEDAIIFDNPKNVSVDGDHRLVITGGGITVWKNASGLYLSNFDISYGHTGFRCNQNIPYRNITLENLTISNMSHEGVYIGPHYETDKKNHNIIVKDCIIRKCGWDCIQIGNSSYCILINNITGECAIANVYGQNYAITINPGTTVFMNNNIYETIQLLLSRVFIGKQTKLDLTDAE